MMATPVPYGASKAQDPGKLSLLLDLSLDIRLLLLEEMFICPNGIHLSCKVPQTHRTKDSSSLLKIQSSVGLLSACRQLHFEILKILYSRNQFKISCSMPDLAIQTECKHAPCWINSLGTNALLLKHVTTQLQRVQITHFTLNLLHLLKMKWRNPHCILDFDFDFDFKPQTPEDLNIERRSPLDLHRLGNILAILGNKSHDLFIYAKFPNLFNQISVENSLENVVVSFGKQGLDQSGYPSLLYTVHDNGKTLCKSVSPPVQRNLTTLPGHIRDIIFDIVNKLDKPYNQQVTISSEQDRREQQDQEPHLNLNLALTSSSFKSTIKKFIERAWLCAYFVSNTPNANIPKELLYDFLYRSHRNLKRGELHVHFSLTPLFPWLDPACINIKPLILYDFKRWLCNRFDPRSNNYSLRLTESQSDNLDLVETDQWLSYLPVRARIVVLLLEWGSTKPKCTCPDIWIDGDGSIKISAGVLGEGISQGDGGNEPSFEEIQGFLCQLPYEVNGVYYTDGLMRDSRKARL